MKILAGLLLACGLWAQPPGFDTRCESTLDGAMINVNGKVYICVTHVWEPLTVSEKPVTTFQQAGGISEIHAATPENQNLEWGFVAFFSLIADAAGGLIGYAFGKDSMRRLLDTPEEQ